MHLVVDLIIKVYKFFVMLLGNSFQIVEVVINIKFFYLMIVIVKGVSYQFLRIMNFIGMVEKLNNTLFPYQENIVFPLQIIMKSQYLLISIYSS